VSEYQLYTASGSGRMIVEIAFAMAELPVEIIEVDWDDLGWESSVLIEMNPLGQLPTVIKPDGALMTESAAIVQYIADIKPQPGLVPEVGHARRDHCLRWLAVLHGAVYPTFTYGDVPTRWVEGEEATKSLKQNTDKHRQEHEYMESFCGTPWCLDETFSAIDLYFWPMRHWRPGATWFDENSPKLSAVSQRVGEIPLVKAISKRNGLPG
jgi:GST-like protein